MKNRFPDKGWKPKAGITTGVNAMRNPEPDIPDVSPRRMNSRPAKCHTRNAIFIVVIGFLYVRREGEIMNARRVSGNRNISGDHKGRPYKATNTLLDETASPDEISALRESHSRSRKRRIRVVQRETAHRGNPAITSSDLPERRKFLFGKVKIILSPFPAKWRFTYKCVDKCVIMWLNKIAGVRGKIHGSHSRAAAAGRWDPMARELFPALFPSCKCFSALSRLFRFSGH